MIRRQGVPMTFTFEVSNGLYALTNELEATFDLPSLHRAGSLILQGFSEYSAFYLRDLDSRPPARLSLNLHLPNRKAPVLRKVAARRSQNLSASFEQVAPDSHDLREILEELNQEGSCRPPVEEGYSDR